jgi:hypothetical protein
MQGCVITHKHSSTLIWHKFVAAFRAALSSRKDAELIDAWSKHNHRTAFYSELVLPEAAQQMGLQLKREFLNIDYALTKSGIYNSAPLIFIESENWPTFAFQEVHKLACVNAPLKVLITVAQWDKTPGVWPKSVQTELLSFWRKVLLIHQRGVGLSGSFGVIVGERRVDEQLRFYFHHLYPSEFATKRWVRSLSIDNMIAP